jgi:hypothetical protein
MTTEKNFRIYEAIAHEDAMSAAERRELTPEQQQDVDEIYERTMARLTHAERAQKKSTRVRRSILAMTYEAVVKRLSELLESHPAVVFAHRDFESLTEDDARTALEDAETLLERLV